MNKKRILGVILLSILFVLAGCSKKELSKIEMIEGSYNTDLGLITIDKDKKLVGFEGFGYIDFKEDADKFNKSELEYYFLKINLFTRYNGQLVIKLKKLTL